MRNRSGQPVRPSRWRCKPAYLAHAKMKGAWLFDKAAHGKLL
jgi:hypothetical protein